MYAGDDKDPARTTKHFLHVHARVRTYYALLPPTAHPSLPSACRIPGRQECFINFVPSIKKINETIVTDIYVFVDEQLMWYDAEKW
jgi:hypothetical protein